MRYTTAQIRLMFNGVSEFFDPDGEWAEVFGLASDELEVSGVPVLCAYLETVGDPSRLLTAEDFQGALQAFRGAAYGGVEYALYDHLSAEIGGSHAELVSPFVNWHMYQEQRYPYLFVEFEGTQYEFMKKAS